MNTSSESKSSTQYLLFVGTYTDSGSEGIYAFRLSETNGALDPLGLASIRLTSTIRLYHVELPSGRLVFIRDYSSGGETPATFAISPSGRWLIAGNQDSGTLTVFPIHPSTGLLDAMRFTVPVRSPASIVFTLA